MSAIGDAVLFFKRQCTTRDIPGTRLARRLGRRIDTAQHAGGQGDVDTLGFVLFMCVLHTLILKIHPCR